MSSNQRELVQRAAADLRELEKVLNDTIFKFKNETGLPVYLGIEEIKTGQIGKQEPTQRIRVTAVL
jgi:hypothetical protein